VCTAVAHCFPNILDVMVLENRYLSSDKIGRIYKYCGNYVDFVFPCHWPLYPYTSKQAANFASDIGFRKFIFYFYNEEEINNYNGKLGELGLYLSYKVLNLTIYFLEFHFYHKQRKSIITLKRCLSSNNMSKKLCL
jgi:hypothetical protein